MYLPLHFRLDDPALRRQLVAEHPLALLCGAALMPGVTPPQAEAFALHLPMRWSDGPDFERAPDVLEGHLSRANPHLLQMQAGQSLLAVFTIPGAYVSPALYDTAQNVPTWNYLAVEIRGRLELVDEPAGKESLLKRLIAVHEPAYAAHWAGLSEDYQRRMLAAIVGLRLHIDSVDAKAKLSQNRSQPERERIRAHGDTDARSADLAVWMDRLLR